MGSQVAAKCECGVETEILIGGGMMNFMTTCFFSCLCEGCHSIVQANLLSKKKKCPECHAPNPVPYDDPRLSKTRGQNNVIEWKVVGILGRELVLTDGRYK
jgi:hypothetical protein